MKKWTVGKKETKKVSLTSVNYIYSDENSLKVVLQSMKFQLFLTKEMKRYFQSNEISVATSKTVA